MSTIMPPEMSADEARQLIDRIRGGLDEIRTLVLDLYERRGWLALGYTSWRECCQAEFGESERYVYRMLTAGRVDRALSEPATDSTHLTNWTIESNHIKVPESHARELGRLREPELIREVYQEVHEEHGERVTARDVREAVQRVRRAPDPEYVDADYTEIDPDPRIPDLKAAIQLLEPLYRDYDDHHAPAIRAHAAALRNVLRQMQEAARGEAA